MKPIHQNENGAVYRVDNSPNPICKFQLVIDSIGIFMSRGDLEHLLDIVQQSYAPCHCAECQGKRDKIWCSNPMIDICLKVDEPSLNGLEDLLRQTFFILDMDATLQKNKLIAGSYGDS
ncbi:MAG TPA: hypothetical protein VFM69_11290 [Pricia sp.]|nr:hypothetical protein [Pricia sp.]